MKKLIILILIVSFMFALPDEEAVELVKKAENLIAEEEYHKAINVLEDARDLDPSFLKVYFDLGECYRKMYDYDKALEYYNIVDRNRDFSLELQRNMTQSFEEVGKYGKAMVHLEKYIEMEPSEALLDTAKMWMDSLEHKDSTKALIVVMDEEDVIKHNEPDDIYYAFRVDLYGAESKDTVLIFARGDELEENILVGLAYQDRRYLRATLPKTAFVEYWLRGSKSHRLREYYITPSGDLFVKVEIRETRRIKDPASDMLEQRHTIYFYEIIIDKKGACYYLIREGKRHKPECFYYKNREE